jgi:hypothetical protein
MRDLWNTRAALRTSRYVGKIENPKKLKSSGIKRLMEDALWTQGVRKKLEPGTRRHEFQVDHGYRKRFKTQCELAGMKSINIEKLMGHSIGISDSYYRATDNELLTDYLKAINFPTIDGKYALERKFSELEEKRINDIGNLSTKLQEKSHAIEDLQRNDSSKNDALAALSDRLQELISEVESLKARNKLEN